MLHELEKVGYEKAFPLFQPLEYQPMCTAVLKGIYPGRVFVDDPDHPQTAFLNVWENWCFLVGNADNDSFNRALNKAIFERKIIGEKVPVLLLTCHPEDWNGQLGVICHPRKENAAQRRHYVCRELKYDWRANLPEGFTIQRMDETLLDRPDLKVPDEVKKTLERWRSIDHPQFQDFGFVTIYEDVSTGQAEVASWSTVDFIVDGVGDVGLVTAEGYRRRGLAAVTAGATADYGFSHGVSVISWTSAENNIGSIRTAERLGFERLGDYVMYWLMFDEANNVA